MAGPSPPPTREKGFIGGLHGHTAQSETSSGVGALDLLEQNPKGRWDGEREGSTQGGPS